MIVRIKGFNCKNYIEYPGNFKIVNHIWQKSNFSTAKIIKKYPGNFKIVYNDSKNQGFQLQKLHRIPRKLQNCIPYLTKNKLFNNKNHEKYPGNFKIVYNDSKNRGVQLQKLHRITWIYQLLNDSRSQIVWKIPWITGSIFRWTLSCRLGSEIGRVGSSGPGDSWTAAGSDAKLAADTPAADSTGNPWPRSSTACRGWAGTDRWSRDCRNALEEPRHSRPAYRRISHSDLDTWRFCIFRKNGAV